MFVNNGKGLLIRFINLDIEKEIEIPENVKIIGKSCFKDEDIIQTVSICKNIRCIEESALPNSDNIILFASIRPISYNKISQTKKIARTCKNFSQR